MPRYTGAWDADATAAFLSETTVPLRLACLTPGERLWMLSLWFRWDDEAPALWCATSAGADVVSYLESNDEVAFEASTNDPPYRGVRGNGTATIHPDPEKELLEALIVRYLGDTDSDLARGLLSGDREEVRIRIDPRRLYSWDFSDRMKDVS
jgi:nitroimidazol reductase NimA-like FMN-containing flavoprotein (pyridoxamine 5'-phosphate oxidase superfamily)